jgi:LmbE family N-acetylglucosaminyl deacetylase
MRLNFPHDRVLAVMAHPDDAELLCAGTLARAREDGAAIGLCVLCAGDKGVASGQTPPDLAATRRSEAEAAAALLGAEPFWLGWPDGELVDAIPHRRWLIEIYRRFQPTLILTHAPEDYHPDHRAAATLAEAASWFCASHGHLTDSPALAAPPALWWADTLNLTGFTPEIYIDVSAQVDLKQRMLACHHSQLQRRGDADFAPLTDLMLGQAATRGGQAGVVAAEAFRPHHAFKRLRAW